MLLFILVQIYEIMYRLTFVPESKEKYNNIAKVYMHCYVVSPYAVKSNLLWICHMLSIYVYFYFYAFLQSLASLCNYTLPMNLLVINGITIILSAVSCIEKEVNCDEKKTYLIKREYSRYTNERIWNRIFVKRYFYYSYYSYENKKYAKLYFCEVYL